MDHGWHRKVMDALANAVELTSPGALTCALADEGEALAIAPSLLEMQDEEDHVFPHFSIDVGAFVQVFDEPPAMLWRTYPETALSLSGRIDGQEASVEVYGQPFDDAQPVGMMDKDGNVRQIPDIEAPAGELHEALADQMQAFRARFGRDPGPGDPLLFDPDADVPTPLDEDQVIEELVAAGHRAGLAPALIYAIQQTGMLVTEANRDLLGDAEIEEWEAAVQRGEELYGPVEDAR